MNPENENLHHDRRTALTLYSLLITGLFIQFVPVSLLSLAGVCMILAALIGSYIYRGRHSDKADYLPSHCTNIIVTIGVGSLIFVGSLVAAISLIYFGTEFSLFSQCLSTISASPAMSEQQIIDSLIPCMNQYVLEYRFTIFTAMLLMCLPFMIYCVYRLSNGFSTARKMLPLKGAFKWIRLS